MGWLSKRKKKTFGWTSKNLRFFVSDPLQGTLCFYKSNIEWKLGEEPRTIVDLVGQAIQVAIKTADKLSGKEKVKLTPADVRKANAARALKNQNRAKNNKKTKKGGQEKVRTFGKANPNAHKSKSVKENMIITCVYVHDDKVHSAESKALMSVYICEEEDWAMVVMNCHREKENGVKVYSERVTGVSLRWGSTYYHTQYDYFHSSHRGHRSWKIDSEKGKEETSKNTDSSTSNREGVGNRKSSKSTKRFSTMPAPISSQHSLSSSNSLNSFDDRSLMKRMTTTERKKRKRN